MDPQEAAQHLVAVRESDCWQVKGEGVSLEIGHVDLKPDTASRRSYGGGQGISGQVPAPVGRSDRGRALGRGSVRGGRGAEPRPMIILTGATGTIGSHVVRRLSEAAVAMLRPRQAERREFRGVSAEWSRCGKVTNAMFKSELGPRGRD